MPQALTYIGIVFQVLIGIHLFFPLILYVISAIRKSNAPVLADEQGDYAIIVTAYEETGSLPAVVSSLLKLEHDNYLVYIVADKCDVSNLKFNDERVFILRPEEPLSSNTRSHFYAINRFKRPHNRLTIIDSDNLVHPAYLKELDKFFNAGYSAVQGVREAKNLDTTYACLDAARDIYYHFYDGKILFKAGSSATLAGSGMAFSTALYRECLEHNDVSGAGFDKVLQAAIVAKDIRIAFSENALVYDEKTSHSDQLVNQRARWINTWFKYFYLGFKILYRGIKNLSINQLLFSMVLLRPPLFIFLLLSVFFMIINLWLAPVAAAIWLGGLICFVAGFTLALKKSNTNALIYKSLINIPKFIFLQLTALFNARNANERSVATRHFHYSEIVSPPKNKV